MAKHPTGTLPKQTHTLKRAERQALGRDLRRRLKHRDQATWERGPSRLDPLDILIEQGKHRLPSLLPRRYGLMAQSPLSFLRGSAAVMAADLAATKSSKLRVQAVGDCHCLNFSGFATPERNLVFDLNDFDDTAVAPWEWDLKRLASSFAVMALEEFDTAGRHDLARAVAAGYREVMTNLADENVLDAWYLVRDLGNAQAAREIGLSIKAVRKAADALARTPEITPIQHRGPVKQPRIKDDPPKVYHPSGRTAKRFQASIAQLLVGYAASLTPERQVLLQRYRLADAAFKVVGVGSVGTRCGVVLMTTGEGETLHLQFKEAAASVLEPYAGASPYRNHGERVVRGQRLIQAAGDILLGFTTGPDGRQVFVRQLRDAKVEPKLDGLSIDKLRRYARACGAVLARAHARSGDAVVLSAYIGKSAGFDEAIADFAMVYARQTERDHGALLAAIKAGRIEASDESA